MTEVEKRVEAQKHLEELQGFLNSRVHQHFVLARKQEIVDTEEAIILLDPVDRATEIEGFKMRGELRCLEGIILSFEDACQTLKDRIEEYLERESQVAATKKV